MTQVSAIQSVGKVVAMKPMLVDQAFAILLFVHDVMAVALVKALRMSVTFVTPNLSKPDAVNAVA
jgi:hypothetical protein